MAQETITGVAMLTSNGEMWALPKPARHGNLFALAAIYHVNQANISAVARRKTWKHI